MKGPSLDAIRKFKELQEKRKREEDEKKIRDKLSTLEHRASQGDRKAKQELKKIETLKEECNRAPKPQSVPKSAPSQISSTVSKKKPDTDFEELMRLAKQNANQIKRQPEPEPSRKSIVKSQVAPPKSKPRKPSPTIAPSHPISSRPKATHRSNISRPPDPPRSSQMHRRPPVATVPMPGPSRYIINRNRYRYEDEEDEEDEDDYESDDFVVDEEDNDVQDEVRKTIRSVFRYDKRRCDLREEELDRQYRAIGRVSTFEDLEREERRASRLAAAEDARALREEEERKKLKKLRLQKPM